MKKTVVVILSLMIVCVVGMMAAVIVLKMNMPQPDTWVDPQGRFSAGYLPGWQVMDRQQANAFLANSAGTGKAAVREQTELMLGWINTGDSVLFISPDRASSIIISCTAMNAQLSDDYAQNRRSSYVQEVERVYREMDAGTETDLILPNGSRFYSVRCENLHPSTWLLGMDHPNSEVFFTCKGQNLYTIVISDAKTMRNDAVHTRLFETLEMK